MPIQLGSAYGKVGLDVSGFLSGVTKSKQGMMSLVQAGQNIGAGLQKIGAGLTLGVTVPLALVAKQSIQLASDLNETKNKVQVIFGDMSDAILKWSEDSAKALGQSRTQALDAASNFAIFGKAAALANDDLVKFAESNVQLAADLASFFNTSPEDAITAIGAAYRGESEPIRRYGVLLNEASLRQKALELGLISSLGPLTQQQRILAANALIMEQTKDAQGDFARTSDGLANSTRILNAEWKDALATLGQNLLPLALMLVQILNRLLDTFNGLSPAQQKMVLLFLLMAAAAGPLIGILGTVISTASSLVGIFTTLSGLGISFASIGAAITGTVIPAVGALLAALGPLLILLAAVALYAGILFIMWKTNFLGMRDNVIMFVAVVKNLWRALMAFLRGDTKSALEYLGDAFQAIKDRLAKIFDFAGIQTAFNNFVSFLSNGLTRIRDWIASVFTNTNWTIVGQMIVYGIANGMLLGLPTLISVALRTGEAAMDAIKAKLGISSPSKAFAKLGLYSAQGFAMGLAQGMNPNDLARTMAKPVNQMVNSQQQNITMNFASGLTMRDVQAMIAANNEALVSQLNQAIAGA